jgi:hypothetical protein
MAGPVAWAQLAAALFDYVENTALLAILAGRDGNLPALARRAALTKFALLYGGWAYILLGLTAGARRRLARGALSTAAAANPSHCGYGFGPSGV